MKIKQILSQTRRDFRAEFECEHCRYVETKRGYDDDNFHTNVIPAMKCPECGKSAPDNFRPLKPKYDPDEIV